MDKHPIKKVENDIRNFIIASGVPGDAITIELEHADGENAGSTFDLSDPDNEMKNIKISVSINYDEAYGYPSIYMHNQTVTRYIVLRVGRVSLHS